MGWLFAFFQKDSVAELKKDKEKLLAKKEKQNAKIDEEIKAINERIAELESKDKGSN